MAFQGVKHLYCGLSYIMTESWLAGGYKRTG